MGDAPPDRGQEVLVRSLFLPFSIPCRSLLYFFSSSSSSYLNLSLCIIHIVNANPTPLINLFLQHQLVPAQLSLCLGWCPTCSRYQGGIKKKYIYIQGLSGYGNKQTNSLRFFFSCQRTIALPCPPTFLSYEMKKGRTKEKENLLRNVVMTTPT